MRCDYCIPKIEEQIRRDLKEKARQEEEERLRLKEKRDRARQKEKKKRRSHQNRNILEAFSSPESYLYV